MLLIVILLVFSVAIAQDPNPNLPFHFTIGNVDVYRIQDSSRTNTLTAMFPSLSPANFTGLVDANGNPYVDASGVFTTNVSYSGTLLKSQGKWILVDDGLGSLSASTQPTRLPEIITTVGIKLTEVNYVLLTHFHTDHTGWNVNGSDNNVVQFPAAQYIAQKAEIEYYNSTPALRNSSRWVTLIDPVLSAGLLLNVTGTYAVTTEVSVIPCIGHTPGHQCVKITSGGKSGIIIGDAMHRPFQVQRPDWSPGFDWNTTLSEPVREQIVKEAGENGEFLIGSHFKFPGVGYVVDDPHQLPENSGWVYVPVGDLKAPDPSPDPSPVSPDPSPATPQPSEAMHLNWQYLFAGLIMVVHLILQ